MVTPFTTTTPAKVAALDLETRAGKPTPEIELAIAICKLNPDWKDETKLRRYFETLEKLKERRALLDSAEIACIGWRSETELVGFHAFGGAPARTVESAVVFGYADESAMLRAFRDFLNIRTDEQTVLTGHNLDAFDLRRLRFRFLVNQIQLPGALANPDQPTADTMKIFGRKFSLDHSEMMIGLSVVLDRLGMTNHKGLCDGEQIGELIAAGQTETVMKYCLLDTATEFELFHRLTGQSSALT